MNFDEILAKFTHVVRRGESATARCPSHEDNRNSLSISPAENGGVVLHCHAGCSTADVVAAVGLTMKDLAPPDFGSPSSKPRDTTYDYLDENGNLRFQVVRKADKQFRQRRPDGNSGWIWNLKGVTRLPYRLPELLASTDTVFIVEGEKDVDRLRREGLTATCNAGGAGKWTDSLSEWLKSRNVFLLPDNDEPGRAHAEKVRKSLDGIAATVRVVELPGLPEKGDVSDWLNAGNTKEQLLELIKPANPFTNLRDATYLYISELEKSAKLIDSGIPDLDYALGGGIAPGEMVVVGGRPGHGKSAIGMQMIHSFSKQGMPCLVLSEEMSVSSLAKRTVQFASDIHQEHWHHRKDGLLADVEGHFDGRADIHVMTDIGTAEKAFRAAKYARQEHGVKAVMIDYAQLLQGQGRGRYEQITNVSVKLAQIARHLELTTIVLCQLNRQIEQKGRQSSIIPNNSDLRDSGQIEQDADVIVFGVWPLKIDPEHKPIDDYILAVTKNRHRGIEKSLITTKFNPSRMVLGQPTLRKCEEFENYA